MDGSPWSPGSVQRASRGNQLAAAFLLAYLPNDQAGMGTLLEEAAGDVMPFAIGLAAQIRGLAETAEAIEQLRVHLTEVLAASADLAVDPDADTRLPRRSP